MTNVHFHVIMRVIAKSVVYISGHVHNRLRHFTPSTKAGKDMAALVKLVCDTLTEDGRDILTGFDWDEELEEYQQLQSGPNLY